MNLLSAILYDPTTAVTKATTALSAMAAFDTTNLRLAATVPAHGKVRFRIRVKVSGASTAPLVLLGVMVGATVIAKVHPANSNQNAECLDADFVVTGLTPGATNFDAAYSVQVVSASTSMKYGGPNDNTGTAHGGFLFEAYDPQPLATGLDGGVNVTQWNATNVTAATAGTPDVNVKRINNATAATPGASGGILISGSNAGTTTLGALTITGVTTYTGQALFNDGISISCTTSNRAGILVQGDGSEPGLWIKGGATGPGLNVTGGTTSGDAIKAAAVGSGSGLLLTGVGTGFGLRATGGGTAGDGIRAQAGSGGHALNLVGSGASSHGLLATGGSGGGTCDGIKAVSGTGGVPIRGDITGNITGNLSGSVGSVTGAVDSVTGAVGSVTGLTASNLDAAVSSRMASYTQPAGFLAATFPATVASINNITGGTITTVTNLTNAPTSGDFTATMKTSIGTAVAASAVASVTGNVGGNVVGSVGSVSSAVTLPSAPTDWITAAAVKADAVTKIQAGLSTYGGGDTGGTTTLLSRLTSIRAGYLDNLSGGAVALASGVLLSATQSLYAPAKAGDAMTLTVLAMEDQATRVEAHLLDEGDSQPLINALVAAIGNTNVDEMALVAAVRADLERSGGKLFLIDAKTTNLPASPAAVGSAMTLATDAVSAAAVSSAAVVKIQDGLALDADLSIVAGIAAAIQAKTDALPSDPSGMADIQAALDALSAHGDADWATGSGGATATEIAEKILKLDWTTVSGEASYSVLNALRFVRNGFHFDSTTLHVRKEDGTDAYTRTVTFDPLAAPVTGVG